MRVCFDKTESVMPDNSMSRTTHDMMITWSTGMARSIVAQSTGVVQHIHRQLTRAATTHT